MEHSPSWDEVTGFKLLKKFSNFYGTRRFITAFTSARHLSLSCASSIQSIPPHSTFWRSILILFSHLLLGLPSGLFPSGFLTKILYTPFFSPICFDFIHIWIFRCKKVAATKPIVENAVSQFPFPFNSTRCDLKLHGHTVHRRYQMLYCPTNALKYIKSLNC